MRLRFRPVDTSFYDLFSRSAAHLVEGATLLAEMFGDGIDREALGRRMRDAEHEADETTHQIIRRANTSVTPFDREDVYLLASGLDDVMDHMEEALDLVVLYGVVDLPSELADQVEVLQRAAEVTAQAMPGLRTMQALEEYWIEVNRLENAGDRSYRRILASLFGGDYDALDVLKLKDIVDSLEAAIDAFETVAHTIEQIAVKRS